MLFTPENARLVMAGTKTQTRRPVKAGDWLLTDIGNGCDRSLYVERRGRYLWGEWGEYAVQPGRGKPSIGRIRITAIRRELLQSISVDDARAEVGERGEPRHIPYLWLFRGIWDDIYGKRSGLRWESNPDVWVLSFEVVV